MSIKCVKPNVIANEYVLYGDFPEGLRNLYAAKAAYRDVLQEEAAFPGSRAAEVLKAVPKLEFESSELIDGLLMMNDTVFPDRVFRDINSESNTSLRVLGLKEMLRPILSRLENKLEAGDDIAFVLPGEGAKTLLENISRLRPKLAQEIERLSCFVSTTRTLENGMPVGVVLSPEDEERLGQISAKQIVILDDVITSASTMQRLVSALPQKQGGYEVEAMAMVLADRARASERQLVSERLGAFSKVFASFLVGRSDQSIPPINTASTFIKNDKKASLALSGLRKYVAPRVVSKAVLIGEISQDSKIVKALQQLNDKTLVLCDLDDTVAPPLSPSLTGALDTLQTSLAKRGDLVFAFNSDSPLTLLKKAQESMGGGDGIVLAERGALLSVAGRQIFTSQEQKTSVLRKKIVQQLQEELGSRIDIIGVDDASEQIVNGTLKELSSKKSFIIVNTGRKASIGLYARRLGDTEEIQGDTALLGEAFDLITDIWRDAGFEAKAYPGAEASILIREPSVNKTYGTKFLLDLFDAVEVTPTEIVMIGNSGDDLIGDSRVLNACVANADAFLKEQACFVSSDSFVAGVVDIINNIDKIGER